jgi:TetR/AcrR family transcriptional repressor of nem operon
LLILSKAIRVMARTKDFDEQEVLDKAVELFWRKGYNATSMQDLVDELGISRSSLYDTFGDKHALFMTALERYRVEGSERLRSIMESPLPAREIIKKLLEVTAGELFNDQQHKGCFMVNAEVEVAPHDKEVNQVVCENDQQVEEAFYRVIKRGQESGEIANQQDARALARFTFNTVKGIRVSAKTTSDKGLLADILKIAMAAFD